MARLAFLLLIMLLIPLGARAQDGIYRTAFNTSGLVLRVEVLDDDLIHFELDIAPADANTPLATSVMVAKTDYTGASTVDFTAENELATPEIHLRVDPANLCVTATDLVREVTLTTICPLLDEESLTGLTFSQEGTTDIYGLGEQFRRRGGTDGNLMGNRRLPANTYGNGLVSFNGGNVGNLQIPVMYALGEGMDNYAIFVDHVYQQAWTFNADPFVLRTSNPPLRWYLMTGADLPDLRADYMELTGTPPVPPKQMFGLWVSEYGYENWDELTGVLDSLKAAYFPLDGFLLDLQWFGGIGENSRMGSLAWDEANFPDPAAFIRRLRDEYGVGVMTIEEPYVSETARGYEDAAEAGVLVTDCAGCPPATVGSWWGRGGMVDWTSPDAAAWWHDQRRQHLIEAGVIGHWTDLGEPPDFSETAQYAGGDQAAVHNIYNLLWSKSIWDGYQRGDIERRPFTLSRSGTAGSQRYGVAMWSGDIAGNLMSLTEQMNVQLHMSLSGIDYFGSDVGGFIRQADDPLLYTLWLANSALLDVPLRPHVSNLQNRYQSAPSLIGDVPSNLANVRLRYELSLYLYTLAHHAYRTGEAVFPPLVYHFQDDPAVRALGSQKMIGSQLMMATLTDNEPEVTAVYLPRGGWFNFRSGDYLNSAGETVEAETTGMVQAPVFVRDGAVIPMMNLEDQTLNILGQRTDGKVDTTQIFNIYHAQEDGSFTLIEDDGETLAYQAGDVRETTVTHTAEGDLLTIVVGAASGTYANAPDERDVRIRLFSPARTVGRVLLNGEPLPQLASEDDAQGWLQVTPDFVLIKAGTASVDETLVITLEPETAVEDRPLLLAHYMPWYQTPDVSGYWGWHWTMNHFDPPGELASHYTPLTGAYDSQDEAILEYQVLLMKLSGIDGVIVDWYGTANHNDYPELNAATEKLFEVITRAGLRFVICYEDRTIQTMLNDGRLRAETAVAQGQADMRYAAERWFGSDAYVTHEGQPLVFVFGPLYFRQAADWEAIFEGFDPVPALVTLDNNLAFGSVANYPWPPMHVSGGVELLPDALNSYLERFYRNAQRRDLVVGSAFPGFHDIYAHAAVRSSYGYLDARNGDTLRHTLSIALEAGSDIVQLVTWNDYGEGTMIEPTEEYGYQYLESIQAARQQIDPQFAGDAQALRLPLRLLQLRRDHAADAAINALLDRVFDALAAGDIPTAQSILEGVLASS